MWDNHLDFSIASTVQCTITSIALLQYENTVFQVTSSTANSLRILLAIFICTIACVIGSWVLYAYRLVYHPLKSYYYRSLYSSSAKLLLHLIVFILCKVIITDNCIHPLLSYFTGYCIHPLQNYFCSLLYLSSAKLFDSVRVPLIS